MSRSAGGARVFVGCSAPSKANILAEVSKKSKGATTGSRRLRGEKAMRRKSGQYRPNIDGRTKESWQMLLAERAVKRTA